MLRDDMVKNSTKDFLEAVRLSELIQIEMVLKDIVPAGAKILEIGAGTGWQARELAARGYEVTAIDIPTSNHGAARIWPIVDFDGRLIPFPDDSFDIVYSSNVLEHVEDLDALDSEIVRVLRSDGTAIHYVPTSTWRLWSLAAFYPALFLDIFRRIYYYTKLNLNAKSAGDVSIETTLALSVLIDNRSLWTKIMRRIVPHAHGAVGSFFSEPLRFSRHTWDKYFQNSGWSISWYTLNEMFLTGEMIFGARLSTSRRMSLSRFFGCTAHLYVLKWQQALK